MKNRRLGPLFLALALALSLAAPVLAADAPAETGVLTRGEFIVALFSRSGAEETEAEQELFADVPGSGELAQAVRWAADGGLIRGYGGARFGPEDGITREQVVTVLYRYARALDQTPRGDWLFPLGFRDADTVSPWADRAMQWAVMNRILIGGREGLLPRETATDGQLSLILDRWEEFLTPEGESRGILILYTGDVHCGIDQGFGYAGLWEARNALTAQGYAVILVDNGDSIVGEPIGTMTKGEAITGLMEQMGYSVAIPGNHEFDYGTDTFLSLAEKAEYPYISCNFVRNGEPVFAPYVLRELEGKTIAFVGVTTPETIITSGMTRFLDENGEHSYSFLQERTGERLYRAVQDAADAARAEGADHVIVMAHLGNAAESTPWTYADVISHTTGIDALLDGHSHDTDQVIMRNAAGRSVPRSACGTKLECIGWCRIAPEGEISTGLYSWDRDASAQELLGLDNEMSRAVAEAGERLAETLETVVAHTDVALTINDPLAVDANGKPVRIVRRMETNLGDLCADAFRDQSGADVAFVNGGGVRASIPAGDITLGDILRVNPFGNAMCVVELTGQQLLDALEWGSRAVPGENGGFLQVSGLSYEIHSGIPTPCRTDDDGRFADIEGERRVKNVLVGGEPIDPEKTYTLAGNDYMLSSCGDGYTMFADLPQLVKSAKLDNQLLIDYIVETLGGVIGEEYADPFGQGRILIVESAD